MDATTGKFYTPQIVRGDYGVLQSLLPAELPKNYNDWLQLRAKEITERCARGHFSIDVEVCPDEFAHFLRTTGSVPDLDALNDFALEKGTRPS